MVTPIDVPSSSAEDVRSVPSSPLCSIVLPIYNEEPVLATLHARLTAAAASWGIAYEVIAVDDGSMDGTSQILAALHSKDPRWKVLSLSRNFGHQTAVSAGLHYSRGDVVAVLDADLQDCPEELSRFLAKWREGCDVVYAVRTRRKESLWKRTCYWAFYRLLGMVSAVNIPLDSGDFCVMDKRVVDVLRSMPERNRFIRGLRSWAGFRQEGIAYERAARHAGEPKYSFVKLLRLAADGILSFSSLPLRLASAVGIGFCGLSVAGCVALVAWSVSDVTILGNRPGAAAGWTSLICAMLFLSGVQMLLIGIMGEYLARIFDEVHQRPPWIIRSAHGIKAADHAPLVGWFARNEQTPES